MTQDEKMFYANSAIENDNMTRQVHLANLRKKVFEKMKKYREAQQFYAANSMLQRQKLI